MKKYIDESYKLYIDGNWVEGSEGKIFEVYNPSDGELLTTCIDATKEDIDLAVKASWKAFESWKDVIPQERSEMLMKIADLIDENTEKLSMIETLDIGKPIRETLNIDVPLCAGHFRHFAEIISNTESEAVMIDNNTMSINLREPLGVIGQIVPWKFPLLMSAWYLAPALAAGNCIVLKPASASSLSVLELVKLMEKVLPAGVVNIITGIGSEAGNYMLEHNKLNKLVFTDSSEIDYIPAKVAEKKAIPTNMEFGGKSANIYFPDLNWDKAIEGMKMEVLFSQGQVSCGGSIAYIHESIYDKFLEEAVKEFDKIKIGLPWEKDTQMGPQINENQLSKILNYIEAGIYDGARVAAGGYRITENGLNKGYYMRPTILVDVNNKMRIAQKEIFGPVVCFIKFKNEEEVIKMVNECEYSLGNAVWTKDINLAFRMVRGITNGRMWVNSFPYIPGNTPYEKYSKSGGEYNLHKTTLDYYMQIKNIFINLTDERKMY